MKIHYTYRQFIIWMAILFTMPVFQCGDRVATSDLLNGDFIDALSDTTAPNILTPINGSVVGLDVVLQWTSKAGAAFYTVEVAADSSFANPVTGSPFTVNAPETTLTLNLTEGNTYYWRVAADTTTPGQFGEASFESLDSIVYVYCQVGTTCDDTDAIGHIARPFKTIAGGIAEAARLGKSEVRVAARDTAGTAYEEVIVLVDGINLFGGYSPDFSLRDTATYSTVVASDTDFVVFAQNIFRTTQVDGFVFINTSVGLNATYGVRTDNCSAALLFNNVTMDGGSGANSYGMYNINSSHPMVTSSIITTGNSSASATGIYNDPTSSPSLTNTTISTGSAPSTSITQNATTSDTSPPSILAPSDGSTQGLTVNLQWTAKNGASSYIIEWDIDSNFTAPLAGTVTVNAPATSYNLVLIDGNTYYWRVRANTTAAGQYGQASFTSLDNVVYVYCSSSISTCDNTGMMGTKTKPFATIAKGIATAFAQNRGEVRVASRGTTGNTAYLETLVLKDGINVTGGYDSAFSSVSGSTIVESSGNFVVYAADIFQATLIKNIQFINTAPATFTATYGVKTDNCSSALQFENVTMDGGQGASAYGMFNTNLSEPTIKQSTIQTKMTATTTSASVGIYNNTTSKPNLDLTLVQTGTSSGYTIGILNVKDSNSSVTMTNSRVYPGNAVTFSAGIAGGPLVWSDSATIDHCEIKSGNASGTSVSSLSLYIKTGSITNSLIMPGTATFQLSITTPSGGGSKDMILTGNILTAPANIYTDSTLDNILIQNNTLAFNGSNTGLTVSNGGVNPNQLKLDNNIVFNTGASEGTGIYTNATITTIDNNLEYNIPVLLNNNGQMYSHTCSAQDTTGIGNFGNIGGAGGISFVNRTTTNGLLSNYINSVYATANNIYATIPILTATLAGLAGNFGSIEGTGSAARFNYPNGITIDGTNLYVTDFGNHTIRQIVISTGAVTTLAGSAGNPGSANGSGTAARFNQPSGITSDGTNLYVADSNNHTIRKIVILTGEVTTLAGLAGTSGTTDSTDGTGSTARFNYPRGITNDGTNLYVADSFNHTIRKIVMSTGAVTSVAGLAGTSGTTDSTDGTGSTARFFEPSGISTDGTNLYIADFNNHTIRKIVISTGAVTTVAGLAGITGLTDGIVSAARFNSPYGITSDSTNLYITDYSDHTIRKISSGGLSISADNGTNWANKTVASGLLGGMEGVNNVFAISGTNALNDKVYSVTSGGLSISTDSGNTWTKYTTANGLGSNTINTVFAIGGSTANTDRIYVATTNGLSVSINSGLSWTNYTTTSGQPGATTFISDNNVGGVYAIAGLTPDTDKIFVVGNNGLSKSSNSGVSWATQTGFDGIILGSGPNILIKGSSMYISNDSGANWNYYSSLLSLTPRYFSGSNIFSSGSGTGLGLSTNYGTTYTNYTATDNLANNQVNGIFSVGNTVYAGTANGFSIGTMLDCHTLLSSPAATGNRTAALTSGNPGSGAVFGPNYNVTDPKTWTILGGGPADLDSSGGWSTGDSGADAANAGIVGVPGAL